MKGTPVHHTANLNRELTALIITIVSITGIYLINGLYFENYEFLFNLFSYQIINGPCTNEFATNAHFLIVNPVMYLASVMPNLPIFGIYSTLLMGLSIYLYAHLFNYNNKKQIIFIILLFFLIVESVQMINNVRISLFLCSAIFVKFFNEDVKSKIKLDLFLFAFILGTLVRVEISVIVSVIGCTIIFLKRMNDYKFFSIFYLLLFSSLVYASFLIIMRHSDELKAASFFYEREFYDKENVHADMETSYKQEAIKLFIEDREEITLKDYENNVKFSMTEYLFENKTLYSSYHKKVIELIKESGISIPQLAFIILIIFISIRYAKKRLFAIVFLIAYLAVPLAILLFARVEQRFLAPYISILLIAILIDVKQKILEVKALQYSVYFLAILFTVSEQSSLFKNKAFFENRHNNYLSYKSTVNSISNNGSKLVVMPNFIIEDVASPRVFHVNSYARVYYLDFYFFTYYNMFRNEREGIFKNRNSLLSRITDVSECKDCKFVSNESYNQFLENYLRIYHNAKISFTKIKTLNNLPLEEYQVEVMK